MLEHLCKLHCFAELVVLVGSQLALLNFSDYVNDICSLDAIVENVHELHAEAVDQILMNRGSQQLLEGAKG